MQVSARSLLPNHWLTCNGFPVILLPQTEPHYCATADVYLQMTSACQLQDSVDNLALCWVRPGSALFCSNQSRWMARARGKKIAYLE